MARTTFSGPVASDNGFITTITDTSTGSPTFNASTTELFTAPPVLLLAWVQLLLLR